MTRRCPAVLALAALLLAAVPAAAENPWLKRRVLNIAHQGGEDQFPSNTLYAFKQARRAGADMLELDISVTKDGKVVVLHDTTVDRVTNGKGTVISKTLAQIRALDAAYWFSPGAPHYAHDKKPAAYRFRGIATAKRKPPKGFRRTDFRIPTLTEVMKAFPKVPINIEIKGRTPDEADEEYLANAEVLGALLKPTRRRDLVVTSFHQSAVDRFHEIAPRISLAPGVEGAAVFILTGGSPGEGVETLDLPMTLESNGVAVPVASPENIKKAHDKGYAWHSWFSGADVDDVEGWTKLIDWCADGIMTSQPVKLEKFLAAHPAPATCQPGS
jgi:glycerophosphoryl diester phosphodiesterase